MTTILALEAASNRCSVALLHRGEILERWHDVPRQHAQVMLPFMDQLLQEAGLQLRDIDALAVGRGPGSFTGVRAAIATAQGLALGSGLPIVAESTLRVLAASAQRIHGVTRCMPLLDARMQEVYAGAFESGEEVQPEYLAAPGRLVVPACWRACDDWQVVGSGLHYREELPVALRAHAAAETVDLMPAARDLAELAVEAFQAGRILTDPADLQPVYLRDQVVQQRA